MFSFLFVAKSDATWKGLRKWRQMSNIYFLKVVAYWNGSESAIVCTSAKGTRISCEIGTLHHLPQVNHEYNFTWFVVARFLWNQYIWMHLTKTLHFGLVHADSNMFIIPHIWRLIEWYNKNYAYVCVYVNALKITAKSVLYSQLMAYCCLSPVSHIKHVYDISQLIKALSGDNSCT